MSARNRSRAQLSQDADEERRLFKEIEEKAKVLDSLTVSIYVAETFVRRCLKIADVSRRKVMRSATKSLI